MLAITRSISLLLLLLEASCGGDAREGGEGPRIAGVARQPERARGGAHRQRPVVGRHLHPVAVDEMIGVPLGQPGPEGLDSVSHAPPVETPASTRRGSRGSTLMEWMPGKSYPPPIHCFSSGRSQRDRTSRQEASPSGE